MSERLTREQVERWVADNRAEKSHIPDDMVEDDLWYESARLRALGTEVIALMDERNGLRAEHDRAREECGHEKAMRKHVSAEMSHWVRECTSALARVQVLEERNRALSEALGGLFAWVSDFLNLGTEYEGTLREGDLPMEDEVPQIRRARATLEAQALGREPYGVVWQWNDLSGVTREEQE